MSRLDFTDPATLAALTEMLTAAGVDGLEITTPKTQIRLVACGSPNTVPSVHGDAPGVKPAASKWTVKAPIAGHFVGLPVAAGAEVTTLPRSVAADDVLGAIRIGHILVPVTAGRAGSLSGALAGENDLIGFGDPLFEIEMGS